MAKDRSKHHKQANSTKAVSTFLADERTVDPSLASLFAGSVSITPQLIGIGL